MSKQETFFVADSVTAARIRATLRYGQGAGYKDRKVARRRHPGEPVFKFTVEIPDEVDEVERFKPSVAQIMGGETVT